MCLPRFDLQPDTFLRSYSIVPYAPRTNVTPIGGGEVNSFFSLSILQISPFHNQAAVSVDARIDMHLQEKPVESRINHKNKYNTNKTQGAFTTDLKKVVTFGAHFQQSSQK